MRIRDCIGFVLIAMGLTGVWVGHHMRTLFGIWWWIGVVFLFLGVVFVVTEIRRRRIEKNLLEGRGLGDYGNTHYHSGGSASGEFDSGGDAGG